MQLVTDLFLLAHQLSLTLGLRLIDNGLGPSVYGSEENIFDYALLSDDKKAGLPSQVQEICHFLMFFLLFSSPSARLQCRTLSLAANISFNCSVSPGILGSHFP